MKNTINKIFWVSFALVALAWVVLMNMMFFKSIPTYINATSDTTVFSGITLSVVMIILDVFFLTSGYKLFKRKIK